MKGCTYIFGDGTRLNLFHHPLRKKPIIQLQDKNGDSMGYAFFHGEEDMGAFIEWFDRIFRVLGER